MTKLKQRSFIKTHDVLEKKTTNFSTILYSLVEFYAKKQKILNLLGVIPRLMKKALNTLSSYHQIQDKNFYGENRRKEHISD